MIKKQILKMTCLKCDKDFVDTIKTFRGKKIKEIRETKAHWKETDHSQFYYTGEPKGKDYFGLSALNGFAWVDQRPKHKGD